MKGCEVFRFWLMAAYVPQLFEIQHVMIFSALSESRSSRDGSLCAETSQERVIFQEHLSRVLKLVSLSIYTGTQTRRVSSTGSTLSWCDRRQRWMLYPPGRSRSLWASAAFHVFSVVSSGGPAWQFQLISTFFRSLWGYFCVCAGSILRTATENSTRWENAAVQIAFAKAMLYFYCPRLGTVMDGVRRQFVTWMSAAGRLFSCFSGCWGFGRCEDDNSRGLLAPLSAGVHLLMKLWMADSWKPEVVGRRLDSQCDASKQIHDISESVPCITPERAVEEHARIGSFILPTVHNIQPEYTWENHIFCIIKYNTIPECKKYDLFLWSLILKWSH